MGNWLMRVQTCGQEMLLESGSSAKPIDVI